MPALPNRNPLALARRARRHEDGHRRPFRRRLDAQAARGVVIFA
jgi:hypothetical protein